MTEIKKELMEMFEMSMGDLELDMDFAFTKEDGYKDKLTVIAYASFIKGIKLTERVLTMDVIEPEGEEDGK